MSCVSKKLFPERFTAKGVKSSILGGVDKDLSSFLSQKAGTLPRKGERFGERFFCISKEITTIYINPSPFTPTYPAHCVRAYAREEKCLFRERNPTMTDEMTCYHCRFFSPGQTGCPSDLHDREIGKFEECQEGFCRRHPPRHGKTIPKPNGDNIVCLAKWPKVKARDWCGEFESRTQHHNCNHRNCANCAKGKGVCE